MQVSYKKYKNRKFTCKNCGWSGNGSELVDGAFHESSYIGDLECPKCFHLIAFWQAPLNNKS